MRAQFYFAIGRLKDAFSDFYQIESKELFPRSLIVDQIWPTLNSIQKETIKSQSFYANAAEHKRLNENEKKEHMRFINSLNSLDIIQYEYENLSDICESDASFCFENLKALLDYQSLFLFYLINFFFSFKLTTF
jgi:hypothetical protein